MAEASTELDARSRKSQSAILQGLQQTGQVEVAKLMGISESTVSRWKTEEVPALAKFLAACNVKAVPEDYECVAPKYLEALRTLARMGLEAAG